MAENPEFKRSVCPYLCGLHDEKTFHTYPTTNNRCCLNVDLIEISHEHQGFFCLNARYIECPLYKEPLLAEKIGYIDAVPDEIRNNQGAETLPHPDLYDRSVEVDEGINRLTVFSVLAATVFIVGVIIFFTLFQGDGANFEADRLPTSTASPTVTSTESPTTTSSPTSTFTNEPTETFTSTATSTYTATFTLTVEPTEVGVVKSETDSPINSPASSSTFTTTPSPTRTPTHTTTATNTSTSTPTSTLTLTYTATSTDTSTSTFTPSSTATLTNTPTSTLTPTATETPTLVPPISPTPILGVQTSRPQPQSEQEVYNLIAAITEDYGVRFAYPQEWQPTNVQEVILFNEYLYVVYEAFSMSAEYMHYFSRASQDVTPAEFFRQHFDQANISLDRVTDDFGIYGTRVLVTEGQEKGYQIQLAPNALLDPFSIVRELGYIINDLLGNVPLENYQQELAGGDQNKWIPADGYVGNESLFPAATVSASEDFEDTFGRMLTGQLSLEVSQPRYEFMIDYLPLWFQTLRSLGS